MLASQRKEPFFHVGGADFEEAEDLAELDQVLAGLGGAAEVGFGDDFHEGGRRSG